MPTADHGDVTIIVRECGERTANACTALLTACFPEQILRRVSGRPFHSTLRNSLELGLREGRKWTLCIDADVFPLPSLVEFVESAKKLPAGIFGTQGLVYDKLLGVTRPAGNHLYRTVLINAALPHIPATGSLRPESAMIEAMAAAGMPFRQSYQVIGLHDFEQYLRDIYAKAFLHGHKHRYLLEHVVSAWRDLAPTDDDFKVAMAALADSSKEQDIAIVSRDHTESLARIAIERLGLEEKLPLPAVAPESVDRIFMAEQAMAGEIATGRARLQQVMDADLAAVVQARQAGRYVEGRSVVICMLSLVQVHRCIGELLELSGKYISAGAEVYWITLDALTEKAGFALPPGVRWLRLCEPGLTTGGIRASIAIATKLVPVLTYLNPAKTISFQRAARHAVRLARIAAGDSLPSATRLSQTDSNVPKWLQCALRLVSPQRYKRLRNEAIAAKSAVDEIFDAAWYSEQYRAAIDNRADMARYFLHVGQYLGHSPHPLFWASWYSEQYLQRGSLPLGHFFYRGAADGLNPNPFFCTKWYMQQAGLPPGSKLSPLTHYLHTLDGAASDPNPLLDQAWYAATYDLGALSPWEHFMRGGARLPCCPFLERHPELRPSEDYQMAFETRFAFGPSPVPPWRPTPRQAGRPSTLPRVAICRVSTGDYDDFEPLVDRQPNADYFFLTDRPCAKNEAAGWRFIQVETQGQANPLCLSREIKMNLTRFVPALEQYVAVVYIDGNIDPVGNLLPMIEDFLASDADLGVIPHPFRQTVYMEAAAIILEMRDSRERVLKVVEMLEAEHCPAAAGLFEMNMFFFRPGEAAMRFFDEWWSLFQKYGRRDQLLAPLVAWKLGTKLHALMPAGHSVRNHPALRYRTHRRGVRS